MRPTSCPPEHPSFDTSYNVFERWRLRTKPLYDIEHADESNERVVGVVVLESPPNLVDELFVEQEADAQCGSNQWFGC